jgi:hypothetical protein
MKDLKTKGASTVVDMPPAEPSPTPPQDFRPIALTEFRGSRPKVTQVAVAAAVASELGTSTDYGARFGPKAPDQAAVAQAVALAQRWRETRNALQTWMLYVQTQDALAWDGALRLMRQLEPLFDAAVTCSPEVAFEYPGVARFYEAKDVVAQRGHATRSRKAKAKADAEQEATITNAVNAALAEGVSDESPRKP